MSKGARIIVEAHEVGTFIKDPRAIVEEADSVHSFVTTLANDMMSDPNLKAGSGKKFKDTFFVFYREWLKWFSTHRYTHIWGKFGSWGNYWDKLMEYKKRANQWLVKYNEIGGKTALDPLPEKKKETSLLKTALYGSLILGGVFVASKVYGQVKGE